MDLDIRTLFVVNVFTALIVSIVMLVIWRSQKFSSSLGWLSLGFSCLMIGALLISTSGYLSDFISIFIGNSIYLLWTVFVWKGTRDFQGLAFPLKLVLLSILAFSCLLAYYSYINVDTSMRIIVIALFAITYSVLTMVDLLKPIHINSPSVEHKYTVAIILVFTLFSLIRIALAIAEKFDHSLIKDEWLQQISVLTFMLYSVALALGFLWMLQRHLEHRVEGRANALKAVHALSEELRKEAENAALHDPLTFAGNRRKFENNANLERTRHLRHKHDLCLAFVDIDHFKAINDKFGHDIGDQVLKSLVMHFTDVLRDIDMVYRWGGEEFLILLPETSLNKAILVCERIREHIQSTMSVEQYSITISIGVTQLNKKESIRSLVKRADQLLYIAKKNGRNNVLGR